MRREFRLPEGDEEHLNGCQLSWETIIEAGTRWLIIHDYPIPTGYNLRAASAALRVTPSYPDGGLDMVYFHPHLALVSGLTIKALTPHPLEGRQWQQWSRHRTPQNPWRSGVDDISTHLLLVDDWLSRELNRS
ncbi:MAG: hypothetical protein EPO61_12665 [Nitrospirae bacterium]|nr:MAG: hypothetical protein EPO61_12665 [Nitrospirota bacterium]